MRPNHVIVALDECCNKFTPLPRPLSDCITVTDALSSPTAAEELVVNRIKLALVSSVGPLVECIYGHMNIPYQLDITSEQDLRHHFRDCLRCSGSLERM